MNLKYVAFLLSVGLLTAALTALVYSFAVVEEVQVYNASMIVGDFVGIAASRDSFNFGAAGPGNSAIKFVNITNTKKHSIRLLITPSGEMGGWITPSENMLVLKAGEAKELRIVAAVPRGTPYGNYTGLVKFTFKRV